MLSTSGRVCYHLRNFHGLTFAICDAGWYINIRTTLHCIYRANIDCREKTVDWEVISRKLRCLVQTVARLWGEYRATKRWKKKKETKKKNDKVRSRKKRALVKCPWHLATISWRKDENNERWPYSPRVGAPVQLLSFLKGWDAACTRCARTPIRSRVSAHACARVRAK